MSSPNHAPHPLLGPFAPPPSAIVLAGHARGPRHAHAKNMRAAEIRSGTSVAPPARAQWAGDPHAGHCRRGRGLHFHAVRRLGGGGNGPRRRPTAACSPPPSPPRRRVDANHSGIPAELCPDRRRRHSPREQPPHPVCRPRRRRVAALHRPRPPPWRVGERPRRPRRRFRRRSTGGGGGCGFHRPCRPQRRLCLARGPNRGGGGGAEEAGVACPRVWKGDHLPQVRAEPRRHPRDAAGSRGLPCVWRGKDGGHRAR
ncbi:hypothetical protein I4F81_009372 [Pyropia yezoensis]|uniref:Uncharacterized protein n=1 Tax=Pyropia yezoensis TaxID=2788 RepID=A0ACC3C9R4_PYRYE|nr:hypothetical protein I4F81_009372 [Neopyropia yezoensis]